MPAPLPVPLRQQILCLRQRGQSLTQIAAAIRCSERSVRRLLQRVAAEGPENLQPRYDHQPHRRCPLSAALRTLALELALQHETWGATYLRLRLCEQYPDAPWPQPRTLQRWLAPLRPQPAPPGRKPAALRPRALRPHDTWQVDASDQLPLRSGQRVSWLRFTDECSGAFLGTRVFPLRPLQPGAAPVGAGGVPPPLCRLGLARHGAGR